MERQNRIGKRTFIIVKPRSKFGLVIEEKESQWRVMFQDGTTPEEASEETFLYFKTINPVFFYLARFLNFAKIK